MNFWPLNIFKRKKDTSEYIAGVNLDDWHYLGYIEIEYHTEENVVVGEALVHGFLHKTTEERHFVIEEIFNRSNKDFSKHKFIIKLANLWKAGEVIYHLADLINNPSAFLVRYMGERGYKFSREEKKWVPIIDEDEDEDEPPSINEDEGPPISNDKERQ